MHACTCACTYMRDVLARPKQNALRTERQPYILATEPTRWHDTYVCVCACVCVQAMCVYMHTILMLYAPEVGTVASLARLAKGVTFGMQNGPLLH